MKVLIVCTNHDSYPTKSSKTGLWLSELTHFYDEMAKRKVLMDIVSPLGGPIPIDERSFDLKDECNARYWEDPGFRQKIENSFKPSQIDPADYRVIYFTGGHGAMWDLPENTDLQNITTYIYENNGMVAAVCHGVAALLYVKLSDGSLLIKDKYLTGFSNVEETLMSFVSEVPFYLEDKIKEQGGHYTKNSARKVASKALEELFEK
jgi:putative intracellular protease/amidase